MENKPIRSYYSLVRSKQADETRTRIAAAARKLILSRGFEAATVQAIAREAGVAVPTVYAVFGSKRRILSELVDRARYGPQFQKLLGEVEQLCDPVARLRLTARIVRQVCDGERSELELLRKARVVTPEIAARHEELECGRYEAQCVTVKQLQRAALLQTGVRPQEARDLLWTFTSRDMYRLLVVDRGWSSDRYERWLGETLVSMLVRAPAGAPVVRRNRREPLAVVPAPDNPIRLPLRLPRKRLDP
jgi:AcrR family transcriptional regulator